MYQIIYIDIDEEITAVIDKLRKSKTVQVFLAIPKRALILQSIVSLKLLSREAEKLEKNIIVATQDPREQKMAEKAGIETRSSLEGLDTEGEMRESVSPKIQEGNPFGRKADAPVPPGRKNAEEIGSDGFYDVSVPAAGADQKVSETVLQQDKTEAPRRMMSEISRDGKRAVPPEKNDAHLSYGFSGNGGKDDLLRKFFEENDSPSEKYAEADRKFPEKNTHVSGRIKKMMMVILASGILVAASAAAYLFVPKAEVKIKTRVKIEERELELKAKSGATKADASGMVIPARMVEAEEVYSFSYPVTGKNKSQGQKAKGKVVIYNEFGPAPQSLVATTRLETPDKRIFRLTKGVTVPGMSEVGGKRQPGAIEAEVIADESGEAFNIDPSTFTIPGFAGSPKFEKFSAKSTEKMKGGSSAREEGTVNTLTQTDLAAAKGKAENQALAKIKEDLKKKLAEGEFLVESAAENTILESASSSRVGDAASEFQYRVRIKSRNLAFFDNDVKEIFSDVFRIEKTAEDRPSISLDYGATSADLESGTAAIKARGKITRSSEVDVEKLKADLAGKSGEEIEELIKNYPQIAEIEIDVQPAFLFKKMPQMTGRIKVILD